MPGLLASSREDDDLYEEDVVFDQSGLLSSRVKAKTAVVRVASGKCFLFAKTAALCAAFFVLGLCIAIPGPTLLDFQHQVNTDVKHISHIFGARSIGYLLGSLIGGALFDRYNRQFLVFLSLLGTSVAVSVAPWCRVLWLLEICMSVMGVAMGFLDTGGNVLCLDLWGRNSGPFMQALHFSFGLGAFVAPLLAEPFLGPAVGIYISGNGTGVVALGQYPMANFVGSNDWSTQGRVRRDLEFVNSSEAWAEMNSDSVVPYVKDVPLNSTRLFNSTGTSNSMFNMTTPFSSTAPLNSTVTYDASQTPVFEGTSATSDVLSTASTLRSKTPKPKPTFTDGGKLDKSQDWDKVPVRVPPPEDLVIPSTSTVSTTTVFVSTVSTSTTEAADNDTDIELVGDITTAAANDSVTDPPTQVPVLETVSSSPAPVTEVTPIIPMLDQVSTMSFEATVKQVATTTTPTVSPVTTPVTVATTVKVVPAEQPRDTSDLVTKMKPVEVFMQDTTMRPVVATKADATINPLDTSSVTTESDMMDVENQNQRSEVIYERVPQPVAEQDQENVEEDDALVTEAPQTTHHPHVFKPSTYDNDTDDRKSLLDMFASKAEAYGFSRFQTAYLIVGVLVLAVALIFLGFLCHNPREPRSKQEEGVDTKKIEQRCFKVMLVVLMMAFFFLYVGMEVAFGQLLLTFAVHCNLHLSKSIGSYLTAIFWGSFAAMRFASIFCASGLTPAAMLTFDFTACTIGTIVLAIGGDTNEMALWVGSSLVGIGFASIFPTGILWVERYIHVSNKVVAIFVVAAAFGEMACPMTVGSLMVQTPMVLMYTVAGANFMCMIVFIAAWILAKRQGEKYLVPADAGYQLASQQDDDDDDMIEMSPASASVLMANHVPGMGGHAVNGRLH